jgi:drug/metabolite transporter (DMT)-like permease
MKRIEDNYSTALRDSPLKELQEPLLEGASTDSNSCRQPKRPSLIERLFKKSYLVLAALGGILFGTSNFIVDHVLSKSESTFRVLSLQGFSVLTYFLCYHGLQAGKLYRKKGHFWSREDSCYFLRGKHPPSVDWSLIKMMGVRYMCSLSGQVIAILTFVTAIKAQVSSAFIISLLSSTSVLTAIVFYFKFGERLQLIHAYGMLLMILSVIFITNSQEPANI